MESTFPAFLSSLLGMTEGDARGTCASLTSSAGAFTGVDVRGGETVGSGRSVEGEWDWGERRTGGEEWEGERTEEAVDREESCDVDDFFLLLFPEACEG